MSFEARLDVRDNLRQAAHYSGLGSCSAVSWRKRSRANGKTGPVISRLQQDEERAVAARWD